MKMEKLNTSVQYPKTFSCRRHQKECEIYCITCDCIVCTNCVTDTHRKHEFSDFTEMRERKRREFIKLKKEFLEMRLPKFMEIVEGVKLKEERYDKQIGDVSQKLDQQMSSIIQILRNIKVKFKETMLVEKTSDLQMWTKLATDVHQRVDEAKRYMDSFEEALNKREIRHLPEFFRDLANKMNIKDILAIPITEPHKPQFERYKIDEQVIETMFGRLKKVANDDVSQEVPLLRPRKLPPPKCDVTVVKSLDFTPKRRSRSSVTFLANMDDKQIMVVINGVIALAEKVHNSNRYMEGNTQNYSPMCKYGTDSMLVSEKNDGQELFQMDWRGRLKSLWKVPNGEISGVLVTRNKQIIVATFTEEDCFGEIIKLNRKFEITQRIETKPDGTYIFAHPYSMDENGNLDIWITDLDAFTVEVIDELGNLNFTYEPKNLTWKFRPFHVVCDSNMNGLISDVGNSSIHVLDRNGLALRYLQTYDHDICPLTLAIEREGRLWVGEKNKGKVHLIQYF